MTKVSSQPNIYSSVPITAVPFQLWQTQSCPSHIRSDCCQKDVFWAILCLPPLVLLSLSHLMRVTTFHSQSLLTLCHVLLTVKILTCLSVYTIMLPTVTHKSIGCFKLSRIAHLMLCRISLCLTRKEKICFPWTASTKFPFPLLTLQNQNG